MAVVTGGASGIGRAVAEAFVAVGATVAVFDVAAADGGYKVDVADEAQVKAAFAEESVQPSVTSDDRLAETDEIVGAVLFLASRASAMVTGHVLAVDGGVLAQ